MMTCKEESEAGFTLVELLVVILLMGIFGGIVTASLTSGLKTTRRDAVKADRQNAVETQLQRMTRDLRVADPIRSVTANSVVMDVYRSGGCRRVEWRVNGGVLQVRTQRWTTASTCLTYPTTVTPTSDTGYVSTLKNITSASPFTYLDATGTVLASPTPTTTKQVKVSLTQSLPENRPAISTGATVYLRNAV